MIAEFASAQMGIKKDRWIGEMDVILREKFGRIKAIAWFDMAKEGDWRIASSAKSLRAYQKVVRKPYYLTSSVGLWETKDWFKKEAKNLPLPQRLEREITKIIKLKTPPVIDGNLTEWNKAYSLFLGAKEDVKLGNSWRDANDLSAKIYLGWDENNLYVAAEVKDDEPFTNEKEKGEIWNGDCLEIALGVNPEADPKRVFFVSGDYQMGLSPGNSEGIKPSIWIWQRTQPPIDVEINSKELNDGSGYIIEAKIPFSNFDSFKPKDNMVIGFDVAIDDADMTKTREVQMVWSGSKDFYRDPSQWGKATFVGRPLKNFVYLLVLAVFVVILIIMSIVFLMKRR
jgi:hypothetical protein